VRIINHENFQLKTWSFQKTEEIVLTDPSPPDFPAATMTPLPRPQPVAGAPLQPGRPTMYDLPSEFPEEPGLPDVFHDLQPQLLS
jgi:hypothetical protein